MSAVAEKRLLLLGAGRTAAVYREALAEYPELVLESIVDAGCQRSQVQDDGSPRRLRSVNDLLRSGVSPHIAVVCSADAKDPEDLRQLLMAGVDLLVESPLASNRHDAEGLTQLAERLGRVLMTAGRFQGFDGFLFSKLTSHYLVKYFWAM